MQSVSASPRVRWWGLFVVSLSPFVNLVYLIFSRQLGPDPGERIVGYAGIWALNFLLVTLAVTPLHQWFGQRWLVKYRRMLGLYAFFYASLHLLAAVTILLDFSNLVQEIADRPYVTVGFMAYLILFSLAATSPKRALRAMGRNWKRLHKSVYFGAVLVLLHFFWLVRADYTQPIAYAVVTAIVLSLRPVYRWKKT